MSGIGRGRFAARRGVAVCVAVGGLFLAGCSGIAVLVGVGPTGPDIDIPCPGYVVIEWAAGPDVNIVRICERGARTLIYSGGTAAEFLAIDGAGNYVVTYWNRWVRRIAPDGSVLSSFQVGDVITNLAGIAIDDAGDYIVAKADFPASRLLKVTPSGVASTIFNYLGAGIPFGVAIDASGDYIVAELNPDRLAKITPAGVRSVIYSFAAGTLPTDVEVDASGDYIVTESGAGNLVRITAGGTRTVLYSFPLGSLPTGLTIDRRGNYVVALDGTDQLVKITPAGARKLIYQFNTGVVLLDVEFEP